VDMSSRQSQEDQKPEHAQDDAGAGNPLPSREAKEGKGRCRRDRAVRMLMISIQHTPSI
jgi:hypothetical protein